MNIAYTLTLAQLADFLLNVATVRPVFIWGAPGIGKSSLVQEFATQVGLDYVSLLGSQLAPEDLIGVPQIADGKSRFCPPAMIARDAAYCLFLDELNACSHEVQKASASVASATTRCRPGRSSSAPATAPRTAPSSSRCRRRSSTAWSTSSSMPRTATGWPGPAATPSIR
jgi:hypothetical protein